MTKSQKQKWEQERAKGYSRFLLRQGVVRCGLPFAGIMALWGVLLPYFTHQPTDSLWVFAAKFVFHTAVFGWIMATFFWRRLERDYKKPADDDVAQ